jgi:hypothetical protein
MQLAGRLLTPCRESTDLLPDQAVGSVAGMSERLIRITLRTFIYNLGLQLLLHPVPVLGFFCPVLLGLQAGWDLKAGKADGFWVGTLMGVYTTVFVLAIGLPLLYVLNLGDQSRVVVIIAAFVFLHVALFAGGGAVVGGQYARREEGQSAPAALRPTCA